MLTPLPWGQSLVVEGRPCYTAALKKIVKAKQQGKEVHATPEQREEQVPDPIEALRASLEARRGTGSGRTRTASSGDGGRKRRAVCKGTPSKARSRR